MTEEQATIPQEGTWSEIDTTQTERHPKVEFEVGVPVQVSFAEDFEKPKEYPNKDANGVFYVFDCKKGEEDVVVMTAAWSLLRGLKMAAPLAGKSVEIVKNLTGGKQYYRVKPL